MIRAVVSDIGRVILWFDNDIFLGKLAELSGKSLPGIKSALLEDKGLVGDFDGGHITPPEFHARVMRDLGADVPRDAFFRAFRDVFSPNAPVLEVLSRVKAAGYKVLLLSNIDPVRIGFIRERFPELKAFDGAVLSCELKLLKPDPAIYEAAARLAGTPPEECVFIDDMEENVAAAAAVGFAGLRYAPGTDLSAELKKFGLAF